MKNHGVYRGVLIRFLFIISDKTPNSLTSVDWLTYPVSLGMGWFQAWLDPGV